MQIKNINRLLLFFEDKAGHTDTLEQLQTKYGVDPDGTNFYYGINAVNVDNFAARGTALNPTHEAFYNTLLTSLQESPDDEKTLMLGVEPPSDGTPQPYAYVTAHMDLVAQLAADLAKVQARAGAMGKRLNIVVRYASEMNDTHQSQGGNPSAFKSTYVPVRHAFANAAPSILFSFSPALRADLAEALIAQYWPGDEVVDVIGGTWYIGAPGQRAASIANMRAYFIHRLGTGKSFALSEMGGCNAAGAGNDPVLEDMFHQLEALQLQNVSFKYVTVFLASKWGTDATLRFLRT
jgi:hypothetical protein